MFWNTHNCIVTNFGVEIMTPYHSATSAHAFSNIHVIVAAIDYKSMFIMKLSRFTVDTFWNDIILL